MSSAGMKGLIRGIVIATASVCTLPLLAGCDDKQNEADKQVRQDLSEARQLASLGANQAAAAEKKLESAKENSAASAAVRANSKAAWGQGQLQKAQNIIQMIDGKELEQSRLGWEITQLVMQIGVSASAVNGQKQFNPAPTRASITTKIADATGGPDKSAWFSHGDTVIPTLTAAKAEIGKLQTDLSQLQDRKKNLTTQRNLALDDAEKSAAQADQLKGPDSVMAYRRASDQRKSAGDAAVQIEMIDHDIEITQQSLSLAQSQQAAVNEVITQLQDRVAALEDSWKKMDAQAAIHQQLSAQILGAPGGGAEGQSTVGGSIYQKAGQIDRLVKEIQALRSEAQLAASNAAQGFEKAERDGVEADRDLATQISAGGPQAAAWRTARETMDPMYYRLQLAQAQRVLGELNASSAASIAGRKSLSDFVTQALKDTGLRLPPELIDSDLNSEKQTALTAANAAFEEADKQLGNIVDGVAPAPLKNAAKVAKALTSYEWAQVARLEGNQGAYQSRLAEAKSKRDLAAGDNAYVPAMPTEMGAAPKPVSAEPTSTEPTSAPATQP